MTTVWRRLKQWAARLRRDVLTLWYAGRDGATPLAAKLLALATAAYAFSPIDLIPDFIPILGMLDELILLPLAIALCLAMIPPTIVVDCRARADAWLAARGNRPQSPIAALAIGTVWIAAAGGTLYWLWRS